MNPPTKKRISDRDPYLRPEYLPPLGAAFTIKEWSNEQVRPPNSTLKTMPVLVFTTGKRLVVNTTSLRALVKLFNDDESASIGKSIVLKPAVTNGKPTIIVERLVAEPRPQAAATLPSSSARPSNSAPPAISKEAAHA